MSEKEWLKIRITQVLGKMNSIVKELPIFMEYESDAREVWPARWEKLREWLRQEIDRDGGN